MIARVREAAARLRRLHAGEDPSEVYRGVDPGFDPDSMRAIDCAILADAYLAEHPVIASLGTSLEEPAPAPIAPQR